LRFFGFQRRPGPICSILATVDTLLKPADGACPAAGIG